MNKIVHQGQWEQTNSSTLTKKKEKKERHFYIEGNYLKAYPMMEWQNQVCGKHVQMTFIKIHFLFIFPF